MLASALSFVFWISCKIKINVWVPEEPTYEKEEKIWKHQNLGDLTYAIKDISYDDYLSIYAKTISGLKKASWCYAIICIMTFLLSIGLPDKYTLGSMVLIPKIAANKDVQQLPANVAKTLNDAVVAWGKDLLPKKDKE